mmetsp:Transcript_34437/g.83318  ORF Transcript_34437/g.83318 Transcript_34437/m.83318 type:complete len:80 (+) Transcript_34437:680-919(+)
MDAVMHYVGDLVYLTAGRRNVHHHNITRSQKNAKINNNLSEFRNYQWKHYVADKHHQIWLFSAGLCGVGNYSDCDMSIE